MAVRGKSLATCNLTQKLYMDKEILKMVSEAYKQYKEELMSDSKEKARKAKEEFPDEYHAPHHYYKPSFEGFMEWMAKQVDWRTQ